MNITANNFSEIQVGHILRVPGRKTPVRVTNVVDSALGVLAFTTSGPVRPSRESGGCVTLWKASGLITWQPTLYQSANAAEVEIIGMAN